MFELIIVFINARYSAAPSTSRPHIEWC